MRTIIWPFILIGCISCSQAKVADPAEVTPHRAEPTPKISWRFPVKKMERRLFSYSTELASKCENLREAMKQTRRHKFTKKAFPGNGFISSVEGSFYHVKYRGKNFTVYKDVKLSFDRKLFPRDPYRDTAGSVRIHPFTIIPGLEHNTPSAFQDIVFGNPLSSRPYLSHPNLRRTAGQPREISHENAEVLSLILNSTNAMFNGDATVKKEFQPELRMFRSDLSMDLKAEDWLIRYQVKAQRSGDLPAFELASIDLASDDEYLYVYRENENGIVSYSFARGHFYVLTCE